MGVYFAGIANYSQSTNLKVVQCMHQGTTQWKIKNINLVTPLLPHLSNFTELIHNILCVVYELFYKLTNVILTRCIYHSSNQAWFGESCL